MENKRLFKTIKNIEETVKVKCLLGEENLNLECIGESLDNLKNSIEGYERGFKYFNQACLTGIKNGIEVSLDGWLISNKNYSMNKKNLEEAGVNTLSLPKKLDYLETQN